MRPATPPLAIAEEQIEFLCPNGHRLHGPASLQGKAGECPECGSRFRVPSYDEVPDVEEQQPEQQISITDSDDLVTLQEAEAEDSGVGARQVAGGSGVPPSSVGVAGPSTAGPKRHPLAGLLARLWAAKPQEAKAELHLDMGATINPQRFFEKLLLRQPRAVRHRGRRWNLHAGRRPLGLRQAGLFPQSQAAARFAAGVRKRSAVSGQPSTRLPVAES